MLKKTIFLSLLFLSFLQAALAEPVPYKGDLTAGIAAQEGFGSGYLDLMIAAAGKKTSAVFIAPRISMSGKSVFESSESGFNIGAGYRKYFDALFKDGFIAGLNLYYDAKNSDIGKNYQQAGAGAEFLSENFDFRANVYFPFARSSYYLGKSYNLLETHNIAATYYYELAAKGFDAELGFKFPLPKILGTLRFFAGYYGFETDIVKTKYDGYKIRGEYKPFSWLSLNYLHYPNQNLTGDSWRFEGALVLPFDFKLLMQAKNPFGFTRQNLTNQKRSVKERMGETVRRGSLLTYKENVKRYEDVVLDEDGYPYHFTVAAPNGTGDGTFTNPANLTDGARLNKQVLGNNAVLLLLGGRYFQSSTVDLSGHLANKVLITGAQGLEEYGIDLSAVSKGNPVINAQGAITLFKIENGNEINVSFTAIELKGFEKTGAGLEINGSCDAVYIGNNSFTDFNAAILVCNSSSSAYGYNNIIRSNSVGVKISSGSASFEQNIFSYNDKAVLIERSMQSLIASNLFESNAFAITLENSQNADISGNEMRNNANYAILSLNSDMVAINSNLIERNFSAGVFADGGQGLIMSENIVLSNGADGFYIQNSSGVQIALNTINSNGANGINASASSNVVIRGNLISSNSLNAVNAQNINSSEISYNGIYDNRLNGLNILNMENSLIAGNVLSNNAQNAMTLNGAFKVSASENEMYDNGADGMRITGASALEIISNTAEGNAGYGAFIETFSDVLIEDNYFAKNLCGAKIQNGSGLNMNDNTFAENKNSGMSVSQTTGAQISANAFSLNGANGAEFNDVFIVNIAGNLFNANSENGAYFISVSSGVLTQNNSAGNASDGFTVYSSSGFEILFNSIYSNMGNGISIFGGYENQIKGNNFYYNEKTAVLITSGGANVSENIIFANNEGIRAVFADNIKIKDNNISSSTAGGIYVCQAAALDINGNKIYSNAGGAAVHIENVSTASVCANEVYDNASFGIKMYNIAESIIEENRVSDNAASGIYAYNLQNSSITSNDAYYNGQSGITIEDGENIVFENNAILHKDNGHGLNLINISNMFMYDNFFQRQGTLSPYYGLFLQGAVRFGVSSGSNNFIETNYGGDATPVSEYETNVKPYDNFY